MQLEIKVTGPTGSGKTLLIRDIKKLLEPKGWIFEQSIYDNEEHSEKVEATKEVKHV